MNAVTNRSTGRMPRPPRLWIDVEDLFQYAAQYRRPSGIQRVGFELQQALREADPAAVRFCRHAHGTGGLAEVDWVDVAAIFATLTADRPPTPGRPVATVREHPLRSWILRQLFRLPIEPRLVLGRLFGGLRQAALAAWGLPGATARSVAAARRSRAARAAAVRSGKSAVAIQPGDILLALGAHWNDPHDAERIATVKARFGLRFGILIYDVIPLRHPEWCYRGTVKDFRRWFMTTVPQADVVMTISRATATDTRRIARALGVLLRAEPVPIPLGTGFGAPPQVARSAIRDPAPTDDLPPPGSYILFVSTIEARKNHALLLRVWRRLLEERPAETIPTLVFAGRIGWLVDDLMQQLENAEHFGGKIRVIEDPSDAVVAALYRGCRFTIYPSHYEGWGLPVTESFGFGKACLAANRTSLPEAGGSLARYFDPDDAGDCFRALVDWLDHPDKLAAAEQRVQHEFAPLPWAATAGAVRAALGVDAISDPARLRSAS